MKEFFGIIKTFSAEVAKADSDLKALEANRKKANLRA